MVTMVLLNVALMWATPRLTLRRCLRFLLLATDGLPQSAAHFLDALLAGHGLPRPLAGAGVGARALAAHRQAAPVPQAAVALDVLQTRDVLLHLPAQRALDGVLAVEQRRQPADVVVGQLLGAPLRIDPRLLAKP